MRYSTHIQLSCQPSYLNHSNDHSAGLPALYWAAGGGSRGTEKVRCRGEVGALSSQLNNGVVFNM